jgi:hypothetical protein
MHFTSVVDCLHTSHSIALGRQTECVQGLVDHNQESVPDLHAFCCHPHVSNSDLSFFLYLNM